MRAIFAALLLVLASSAQAAAQTTEAKCEGDAKADLDLITKIGTRRVYELFFNAHRTGPCVDIARQQLQQMDPQGMTKENWGDEYFIPRLDRRN